MHARRALLKKLASITDWDTAKGVVLEGESWIETRNTLYRLRDGTCVAVASRDATKNARASTLVGMRLVGWLAASEGRTAFTQEWVAGACAVLWRPGADGTDEAMGMTSATTAFKQGHSPSRLQALRDKAPPADSQTFARSPEARVALPSQPTHPSFRSG